MKARHLLVIAGVAALAACQPPPAQESETPAPAAETAAADAAPANGCAVIANRNWTAHINAMPGPNAQRTLNVSGEIDLPTPGYTVTLREGPADRSARPVQQLILDTAPPAEIAAIQVVTPTQVSYQGPALGAYSAISIMCGGSSIATISDIPEVH